MRYTVSMAVDGRIDIAVDAANPWEARVNALRAFATADLAGMTVVGKDAVNCADANGRLVMDY